MTETGPGFITLTPSEGCHHCSTENPHRSFSSRGGEKVTQRGWWGNSPAAVELHLGGSFCSLLGSGLGFVFFFLPLLKKKFEFPDLHQSKNFIYMPLKKTNASSLCLKYRGNTELGHWKPAQSSAGQGTNLRMYQLCFGKCNSYYNDIESNFKKLNSQPW